jgi:chromosome segregation ATPase
VSNAIQLKEDCNEDEDEEDEGEEQGDGNQNGNGNQNLDKNDTVYIVSSSPKNRKITTATTCKNDSPHGRKSRNVENNGTNGTRNIHGHRNGNGHGNAGSNDNVNANDRVVNEINHQRQQPQDNTNNHHEQPQQQRQVQSMNNKDIDDHDHVHIHVENSFGDPNEFGDHLHNRHNNRHNRHQHKNDFRDTTSILNTTNDNDISYDESINSTSVQNLKQHYETLLSNQQTTHNQQIDDILLQLSSIESTYHDEISNLQKNLSKKEVMCDALTASLSDYKKRNFELTEEIDTYEVTCNELEYKFDKVSLQFQEARREATAYRQHYDTLRISSEQDKKDAILFAQHEIQSQAETQFAIAQKKYMQLKTNHKQSLQDKEILQEQLSTLQQQMDNKERVHKSHISQLQEELNVVRGELSSSRMENQKVKGMLNERMTQLESREKNLDDQLDTKVKECQELVREKRNLTQENAELQSLCEELMGIVESGNGVGKSGGSTGTTAISNASATGGGSLGGRNQNYDYSSPSVASRSSRSTRSGGRNPGLFS